MSRPSKSLQNVWRNPALLAYNAMLVLALPVSGLAAGIRNLRRGKAWVDRHRWNIQLLGKAPSGNGPRIALAGVSYGEWVIVRKLAQRLKKEIPGLQVTYLLRNPMVLQKVVTESPDDSAMIWPSEFILPVAKFLAKVEPDLVVISERCRYPNLVRASKAYGADVVLVNGRTRPRESFFYQLFGFYYRWFFRGFRAFLMQNEKFAQAVKGYADPDALVVATGDLKFDLDRKDARPPKADELDSWLSGNTYPLLIAGSTDRAEEERAVLEAFCQVRQRVPASLLLAPRNVERRDEVLALIEEHGLSVSVRSQLPATPADVYLLDTLGELSYMYRKGVGAYVGGAMFGMGHNVLEPVELGLPVAYGVRRGHFEQAQLFCEQAKIGTRIQDAEELAKHWLDVLGHVDDWKQRGQKAVALLEAQRGAMDRTVAAVLDVIRERERRTQ